MRVTLIQIFLPCLFCIFSAAGQKVVKKELTNPLITSILIDANLSFELKLRTADTNEVIAEAIMDGEYYSDVHLKAWEEGKALRISTGFNPSFVAPNDKLGAHKSVAISLVVTLPRHMVVHVIGAYTNVVAQGSYQNLSIVLASGECTLNNIRGAVKVQTHSGSIYVGENIKNIKATTTYGVIYGEQIANMSPTIKLNSVTGNIYLKKPNNMFIFDKSRY